MKAKKDEIAESEIAELAKTACNECGRCIKFPHTCRYCDHKYCTNHIRQHLKEELKKTRIEGLDNVISTSVVSSEKESLE